MTYRRSASVLGTIALVLTTYSTTAAAHGVDVIAELEESTATLELTDETGEVCIAVEPDPADTAVFAIANATGSEVLISLGEGFGATATCQLFDVDTVNSILDDVDAHRLVMVSADDETSAILAKPPLGDSETATADVSVETAETNVPLVFGVGMALGLAVVIIRKRFFS